MSIYVAYLYQPLSFRFCDFIILSVFNSLTMKAEAANRTNMGRSMNVVDEKV